MPSIYLAQKVGTYKAQGDSYTVTEDIFKYSNYFKKMIHLPQWLLKIENIEIHKGSGPSKDKFYLKPDKGYTNSRVLSISVYFNTYDSEHKNPLVFVLDFTDNLPKYMQNFIFSTLMSNGQTEFISKMFDYHSDVYMLDLLISENDLINDIITFSVDIKNEKNTEYHYNVSRILISAKEYVKGKVGDTTHGFYRFRHKPKHTFASKPSYFLYNKNLPLDKKKEPIQELQGKKYNVTVYWTDKTDLPLLLEFNIGGHTHSHSLNNVYYITRYYDNHIYFEKLDYNTHELNQLVLNPNSDMYTILTSYDNQILIGLLKLIQYNLLKTMVVVLDKKKEYGSYDVSSILKDYDSYRLINKYAMTKVRCQTKEYGKCLQDTIFEVYEHDFSHSASSIKSGETVKLNFIVPDKVGTTYQNVSLHTNFTANVKNYLYYTKNVSAKVYVYFYGDDIRPLLFCYDNKAYRIHDIDHYSYTWYRIDEITNCTCNHQGKSQDPSDKKLIEILNLIVKQMGLVKPQVPIETKKELKQYLSIDISKTSDYEAPSPFKRVKVSEQKFDESDLFCYHSHNLSDYSLFYLTTFIFTTDTPKTIKLEQPISNVRSIDVYMNTFIHSPLIVSINTDSDKTLFYKDLIKNDQSTYTIKQDTSIKKNVNLYENLFEQNDKINNTSTFLIDKISTDGRSVSYGYDGRISISQSIKNEFTLHTHTFRGYSKSGYLLYNKKMVKVLQEGELITKNSQVLRLNTNEDLIGVYYLSSDLNCKYPLLIGSRQSNNVYSFYKLISTSNDYKWQKIKLNFTSQSFGFDSNIISLLDTINYYNKSSIIIELDKKDVRGTSYPMRIIDNKTVLSGHPVKSQYSQGTNVQPSINISVSHPNIIYNSDNKNHSDFRSVSHEILESKFTSVNKRDICGLRLFILMSSSSDPVEAFLYDSKNSIDENQRVYLYYKPGTSENIKLYVYYNKDDLRPLLICYNQKTYKLLHMNDNTKWVFVQSVRCHESPTILSILKGIHITVKKKIIFLKDGSDQTNVKSSTKNISEFHMIIYEPNKEYRVTSGPFRLSKSVLIKGVEHSNIIDTLFANLYSKPFEKICSYYKIDPTKPLLFEFVDEFKKTHFQRRDADGYYWINEPFDYDRDDVLAKKLREIDSAFNVSVIYEIDKISGYSNVTVEHISNVPEHGFTKYIHKNKGTLTLKKSLVLIKGLKLMKRHRYGKVEIFDEIERHSYSHINVYFNSSYLDTPLIIELPKSEDDNQSDFYCHKKDISGNYWEKFTFEHSRRDKELTTKLKKTLFNITDSIVIFMDKRPGSGYTTYGFSEMQDAITNFIPQSHTIISPSYSNSIKVVNQTHIKGLCISEYGYKIFEHQIVPPSNAHSRCGIKFFIPNSIHSRSKYSEISFHTNITASDYNKEYIYCDRADNNVIVICFDDDPRPLMLIYAGTAYRPKKESNPIPEKQVIVDYNQWILDNTFPTICEGYQALSNSKLLNSLFEVVCYLNPVQINPQKISTLSSFINKMKSNQFSTDTYVLHKYSPDTTVELKITATNLSCYRKYSYESHGTNKNSYGFRLGDVIYQGNITSLKTFKVDYSNSYNRYQRLLSVEAYYSLYDFNHQFPLLVVLEFVNSSSDFYELISNKDEVDMRWAQIRDHVDSTQLEAKLYEIKNRLGIQFDTSNDAQTLFKKDQCYEDSNKTTIIAATSGTISTAAVVGTGTGLALKFPEWFIPVIKALT